MSEPVAESIDLGERARSNGDDLRIISEFRDAGASRNIRMVITVFYLLIMLIFSAKSGFLIVFEPENPHATTMVAVLFLVMGAGIENIRQRILEAG